MSTPPEPLPIVIIGAGLAGLAAAVRLGESGRKVIVLESTSHGGGRTRSFDDAVTGRRIDNGQHLVMGCYRETKQFLRAIGTEPEEAIAFQKNLAVDMVRPGGKRVVLHCPALPAPLHLAGGLLAMRGVGLIHKLSALRAGLMLPSEAQRPDDTETCDHWLTRMGQTPTMRAAFWDPLIWATLNDDPLVSSAAMLLAVLERAFLGTRDASQLGVPRRPLSELYVPQASDLVRSRGGEVRMSAAVKQIVVEDGHARAVITKAGERIDAETIITSVPPHALLDLLPERVAAHVVFRDVARLKTSPIVNLWALVDRSPLGGSPFVGLIGSPLHWLFDRDRIEGRTSDPREGTVIAVTISGARAFVHDEAKALEELFLGELRRYFPGHPVHLRQFRVVKEKRATISHAAGTYQWRPEVVSPVSGLLLAGDWVRTGLPATIESAVQSGHDAARVIVDRP